MKQPIDPITLNSSWPWHPDWLPHHDLTTWTWSSPGWSPIFDITLQPGEGLFFPPGMVSWLNRSREGTDPLRATKRGIPQTHFSRTGFMVRIMNLSCPLFVGVAVFCLKPYFWPRKLWVIFDLCWRRLWSKFQINPKILHHVHNIFLACCCIYLSNMQAFGVSQH